MSLLLLLQLLLLHLMLIVVHLLAVWVTLVNHVWTDMCGQHRWQGLGLLQGQWLWLGGGLHQLLLQLPALLLLLYCQTLVRYWACVGEQQLVSQLDQLGLLQGDPSRKLCMLGLQLKL